MTLPPIDALVFDIQGTLLDFFTPVRQALADALSDRALPHDPTPLVNAWRQTYFTGMTRVTKGERAFVPASTIYREGLDQVLSEPALDKAFSATDRDELTRAWTWLVPWPDTADGLRRLRGGLILTGLTNGGMAPTLAMISPSTPSSRPSSSAPSSPIPLPTSLRSTVSAFRPIGSRWLPRTRTISKPRARTACAPSSSTGRASSAPTRPTRPRPRPAPTRLLPTCINSPICWEPERNRDDLARLLLSMPELTGCPGADRWPRATPS
jgi:hypothetical protein